MLCTPFGLRMMSAPVTAFKDQPSSGGGVFTNVGGPFQSALSDTTPTDQQLLLYDVDTPLVEPRRAATLPSLSVSIVLPAQLVTENYMYRYVYAPDKGVVLRSGDVGRSTGLRDRPFVQYHERPRRPAWRGLEALGSAAIIAGLRRLEEGNTPVWLMFLQDATGERPAAGTEGISEAAAQWRRWGQARGLMA